MKALCLLVLSTFVCVVSANFKPTSTSYFYNSLANGGYSFEWNVLDAYNNFGHREDRGLGQSGTDETRGSYHVLLPDGRVQTVTYFVDPYNGYQAKVLYEGESKVVPYTKPQTYQPVVYHTTPPPPNYAPVVVTTTTPAPKLAVEAKAQPVYAPVEYKPAKVEYPHNPVYNLVVPEYESLKSVYAQAPKHVQPLAPPPKHHKSPENEIHHDPYLKTDAELAHYDFSGPFFYANTKKIVRKEKDKSHAYKIYY